MGCCFSKDDDEPIPYNRGVTTNIHYDIHRAWTNQNFTHSRQHVTLHEPRYGTIESNQLLTRLRLSNNTRTNTTTNTTTVNAAIDKPLYGEYKCKNCGRFWNSRLCWRGKYQLCKNCKKPVFPYTTREVLPSDHSDDRENKEHEKELCEMCKSLGYYCNNKNKKYKNTLYSQ